MNLPKSILLIEDDKDDQEFFLESLNEIEKSYVLRIVENGENAIHFMNTSDKLPDIIFSDINMPGMGGIKCLMEIKKNPVTKNIPVFILSSDLGKKDVTIVLGAKAFLKKIPGFSLMKEQIRQAMKSICSGPAIISF